MKISQFQGYKKHSVRYLLIDRSEKQLPRPETETETERAIWDSSETLELEAEAVERLLCQCQERVGLSGLLKVWSSFLVQPKVEPEVVMLQCSWTQLHCFSLDSTWLQELSDQSEQEI